MVEKKQIVENGLEYRKKVSMLIIYMDNFLV